MGCRYAVLALAVAYFAGSIAANDSQIVAVKGPASIRFTPAIHVVRGRFLRAANTADERNEDRGINLKSMPGFGKIASLFTKKNTPGPLLSWFEKKKSPDYVFLKLKINKGKQQLFDHPDWNVWVQYTTSVVKSDPEEAMIAALRTHYTDDILPKLLESAKNVPKTSGLATKMQMEHWVASKTPSQMFQFLRLDKVRNGVLDDPTLSIWINYMKLYNSKPVNKKQQVTLVSMLTTHYKDRGVLDIIEAAKKVPKTAPAARQLEMEQIQFWLKNGKSPDELLTVSSLDKAGNQLLASPRFKFWSKYIDNYNRDFPDEATTVMATLRNQLGDEDITPILIAAGKAPSTEKAAAKLQAEQFKSRLRENEDPAKVFQLLKLDNSADDLLGSPQFKLWGKYVEDLNLKPEHNDLQVSIITILRKNYGDDVLGNMVLAGKKAPSTSFMARRLEDELYKGWIAAGSSPDGVFKHLKFDKAGENVIQSPLWGLYTKFLEHYYKSFPTPMMSALAKGYDGDALAKLLIAAEKIPTSNTLATKLQTGQIQRWLDDKDQPGKIFKALLLDDMADDILTSPLFNTWTRYLDEFNKKFPDEKVSMTDTFRTSLDDETLKSLLITAKELPDMKTLSTKLQTVQIERWLASKTSPEDAFAVLALNKAGGNVLSKPLLNTWAAYLESFNAKFPRSRVPMIDTFREFFGDKALLTTLAAAKEVESTKKVATSLQDSLLSKWVLAKKPPSGVAKLVGTDEAGAKLLKTYTTKYMERYGQ
uniref:Suppressor of RNA silencing n=1 Tax=Phytophthora infestans TaxID=4787 RepID=A0A1D6ZNX6_PHYIN|nr:suppressor of RNA silencing [Phytophthora infestans]